MTGVGTPRAARKEAPATLAALAAKELPLSAVGIHIRQLDPRRLQDLSYLVDGRRRMEWTQHLDLYSACTFEAPACHDCEFDLPEHKPRRDDDHIGHVSDVFAASTTSRARQSRANTSFSGCPADPCSGRRRRNVLHSPMAAQGRPPDQGVGPGRPRLGGHDWLADAVPWLASTLHQVLWRNAVEHRASANVVDAGHASGAGASEAMSGLHRRSMSQTT